MGFKLLIKFNYNVILDLLRLSIVKLAQEILIGQENMLYNKHGKTKQRQLITIQNNIISTILGPHTRDCETKNLKHSLTSK